jgi:tRNA modification GTPase
VPVDGKGIPQQQELTELHTMLTKSGADPADTIVALSSPPGPGARAVVRISGPDAARLVGAIFSANTIVEPQQRRLYEGCLHVEGLGQPLPADLYVWPGPRTFTGQDHVEIHTLSCPPLLDRLVAQLLNAGARAAQPGEFTLRAFLAGKLDLPRAEAVGGVIEATSRAELTEALTQLAGGVTRPLEALREDLLNLLAEIEAGLDFAEEDIRFVGREDLLVRLSRGLAQVTLVQRQLNDRAVRGRRFQVVLAGRPNVGKSSLFNALAGDAAALVSPAPGTTRDYLVRQLELGENRVDLVDTAGWQFADGLIDRQAQQLGREQAERADLLLLCLEAGQPPSETETAMLRNPGPPAVLGVETKCDLAPASKEFLATSSQTGLGLDALRAAIAERARAHPGPALAPSLARCRHHVDACLGHLRQAHAAVLFEDPPEILALELRGALDQLGQIVGAVYTDDLLDRIFSRFCIGK